MTITDARIKVSFDRDEEKALTIARNIIIKLQIKDVRGFLDAFVGCDWVFYDEFGESTTAIEFLNNMDKEEEEEE